MTAHIINLSPRMKTVAEKTKLNKRELTSIRAMLAYKAHERNLSEDVVHALVASHFKVDDVAQLPRQSFDAVIRFLVDLQADLLLN